MQQRNSPWRRRRCAPAQLFVLARKLRARRRFLGLAPEPGHCTLRSHRPRKKARRGVHTGRYALGCFPILLDGVALAMSARLELGGRVFQLGDPLFFFLLFLYRADTVVSSNVVAMCCDLDHQIKRAQCQNMSNYFFNDRQRPHQDRLVQSSRSANIDRLCMRVHFHAYASI
jgi:hypothetical protein